MAEINFKDVKTVPYPASARLYADFGYSPSNKAEVRDQKGGISIEIDYVRAACCTEHVEPGKDYIGIMYYAWKGKPADAKNSAGILLLKNSKWLEDRRGGRTMHQTLYEEQYGGPSSDIVATGFGIMDGQMRFNSYTFNAPQHSTYVGCLDERFYANSNRTASQKEQAFIERVVESFKNYGGPVNQWKYYVSDDAVCTCL